MQTVPDVNYPGLAGTGETAHWFAEYAAKMGVKFQDLIPQRIHLLPSQPHDPKADGSPRTVGVADAPLLLEWLAAFHRE